MDWLFEAKKRFNFSVLDSKQKAGPLQAMTIIISSGKISPILAAFVCRGLDMIQGPMMQSSMASFGRIILKRRIFLSKWGV